MFTSRFSSYLVASVSALLLLDHTSAADVAYCSDINTADTDRNSSLYQSNGLCSGFCIQNYAFAVVQDQGCWCSNYIPKTTTDGCNLKCPGYGFEECGGQGLFGYIALSNKRPSGTKGVDEPSSTLKSDTTTNKPSTDVRTSSTWTPTPFTSLMTITGVIQTVTITPTNPADPQGLNTLPRSGSGGLNTGAAVGLTIGLVALFVLVGAVAYFCVRRRRQEAEQESTTVSDDNLGGIGKPPSRTMSENSRFILTSDARASVQPWEGDAGAAGSRTSRHGTADPRLNPFFPGTNNSRESLDTIRDDQDYSRRVLEGQPKTTVLRTTNPDP